MYVLNEVEEEEEEEEEEEGEEDLKGTQASNELTASYDEGGSTAILSGGKNEAGNANDGAEYE